MKRVFIFFLFLSFINATNLEDILSSEYKEFYSTQLQKALIEKNLNSKDWIAPIILSYEKSWDNIENSSSIKRFSIIIDQPIFKSGGIYYGIKFAKAKYLFDKTNINKEKKALIIKALNLLYQIKITKLNILKSQFQLKNLKIEAKQKQELYEAGIVDLIEVDNVVAKKQEAQINLLNLQASLEELQGNFKKISSKNPNKVKLPKLKIVSKKEFIHKNYSVKLASYDTSLKELSAKLIATKYLPTLSFTFAYTKTKPTKIGIRESVTNYGLKITMPISINMKNDLQKAKLDKIISKINYKNQLKSAKEDYNIILKRLNIINRQINLTNKEIKIYKRLLANTKKLYKAGQRSIEDVKVAKNSYKIKTIDIKIYKLNKHFELLKLYEKME